MLSWTSFEPRRVTWSTQGGWWWRWLWATWPGLDLRRHQNRRGPDLLLLPGPGSPSEGAEGQGLTLCLSWQVDTKNQGRLPCRWLPT